MADTQHTRTSGKAQMDTTYADNTSESIGAGDWRQEGRDFYESAAILASTNYLSEDNVFGEIDHVQVFGATSIDAYNNTNEVQPTVHVYCDDQYAIRIENTDNVDADTKAWVLGQEDDGDFLIGRISESGGADTFNSTLSINQNNIVTLYPSIGNFNELTISAGGVTITGAYHSVDTESDASTDNLGQIDGASSIGQLLFLRPADDTRTIVVKDGTGNLRLAGDHTMDGIQDTILLLWNGDVWLEISRSNNN